MSLAHTVVFNKQSSIYLFRLKCNIKLNAMFPLLVLCSCKALSIQLFSCPISRSSNIITSHSMSYNQLNSMIHLLRLRRIFNYDSLYYYTFNCYLYYFYSFCVDYILKLNHFPYPSLYFIQLLRFIYFAIVC